jgi:serine/threonine protein kinase
LKLENILLADESSKLVKIVDFGIAGLASNFNISKVDVGTLRYMPPESLTGKISEIGYPIDVWALGIILYGMVAGTLPFDGDTPQDIVKQVIKLKYKVPPDTSEDLKNLWQRIFV